MKLNALKINKIVQILKERYPVVNTQLEHKTAFQLLIATIMSAQCTDNQVNKVSKNYLKSILIQTA